MEFFKSKLFRFIASLGLAALFYFLCPPCFNKLYLGAVLLLLVLILNLPKIFGYKWLTHLCRLAVGGLFIFSGFIKANDPVGFSIKLKEYFEVFDAGFSCDMKVAGTGLEKIPCEAEHQQHLLDKKFDGIMQRADDKFYDSAYAEAKTLYQQALTAKPNDQAAIDQVNACNEKLGVAPVNKTGEEKTFMQKVWMFFADHALFLAIFICGFEIVVGIFLLLGIWPRWTLLLLLAMIVFFSFLTFYSACCNKVTSCGCFGDAIKLTPWESFWKDLILLILIAALFVGEQHLQPLFKNRILQAGITGIGIFLSFAFPLYTWRHLPVIDFRPYKIGTNLYEAMQNKDPKTTGCQKDSIQVTYYYQHLGNGKIIHFLYRPGCDSMDLVMNDTLWDYYCRQDVVFSKGNCEATVKDFNLVDPETGESLNDSLLKNYKGVQFFWVMEDMDQADRDAMQKANVFYDQCKAKGIPFNALSGASYEMVEAFRKETGAKYPVLQVDGTALKTVIRSNPGLVMLNNGVVTDMWHWHDFPEFNEVMTKIK